MTNSNLVQTVQAALKGKGSFADVFRALHVPQPLAPTEVPPPVLPTNVKPSEAQLDALARFPALLASYKAPKARRKLTLDERKQLNDLVPVLRELEGLAKATRESVRTTFLNHGDVVAEEKRLVDPLTSPRDKDGHYLIKDEDSFAVPGQPVKLNRKLTPPSVSITAESLHDRVVDLAPGAEAPVDKLTHKDYLEMTEPVRVTNMQKITAWLRKHPARALALKEAAQFSGGSVAITESKNVS